MERRKVICDKIHGVLDYGVVVMFVVAPGEIDIVGPSAALCYALAAFRLVLTLCSDIPLGVWKIIPMRVNGLIELTTSLALIAIGWMLPSLFESGQLFFTLMGAITFVVWVSSDYGDQEIPLRA
jgi:hypothetical protein